MAGQGFTVSLADDVVMQVVTDDTGPVLVADQDLSGGIEMVRKAIEQVGGELAGALRAIAPTTAKVELGFNLSIEAGKVVAVLVGKGSATASIKVTLEWTASGA